MSHDTFIIQQA